MKILLEPLLDVPPRVATLESEAETVGQDLKALEAKLVPGPARSPPGSRRTVAGGAVCGAPPANNFNR